MSQTSADVCELRGAVCDAENSEQGRLRPETRCIVSVVWKTLIGDHCSPGSQPLSVFPSHSLSHLCPNQEAQAYAEDNSLLFMETSAKTAMNVNEIFMAIGKWPLFPSPSQGVLLACCPVVGLWGPFINRSFTIFSTLIKLFSFSSLR